MATQQQKQMDKNCDLHSAFCRRLLRYTILKLGSGAVAIMCSANLQPVYETLILIISFTSVFYPFASYSRCPLIRILVGTCHFP